MKKFIIFSLIMLVITALHANGACLLKDLKNKNTCTGGASSIDNNIETNSENINKQELQKMYQIPAISVPRSYDSNKFPALNQNCMMYGGCFPDLK